MPTADNVVIGRVGRPHGLDGAFFVEQPSDDPRWFKTGARLWVGGEELEVVTARRGAGGRPVIRFEREVPRGSELTVPLAALPPTEEGEYYTFQLVGLEVVTARRGAGGRPVIRFDREVPRGSELTVPLAALPPTEEGEYYTFQLVGLEVVEEGGRPLGTVTSVEPGVANDALALDSGLLLPLVEACVRDIDLAAKRILVSAGFSNPA